jgi:HEPN superfamily AbiU2-like protein
MTTATSQPTITATQLGDRLLSDLFQLQYAWDNFLFLFALNEKHVQAMNAVRGGFFARMQSLMFIDVLLRVSRLTDDATVARKPTASLPQLLALTSWQGTDRARWSRINDSLKAVLATCQPCRDHRNSTLAHSSLHVQPLAPATRKMVDDAIGAIDTFLEKIRLEWGRGRVHRRVDTRESEKLLEHLLNRRSQKDANLVALIVHEDGSREAQMQCGFCGERVSFPYYPDGEPPPQAVARLHFAGCEGVIGFEVVKLLAVERNDSVPPRVFILDLSANQLESDLG